MFTRWLQGNGREPRTWRTLIVALEEANLHTIAQELRDIFPVQFSGTSSDHAVQTNSSPTGILVLLCKWKVCLGMRLNLYFYDVAWLPSMIKLLRRFNLFP